MKNVTHHTIVVSKIECHIDAHTITIQSPAGPMQLHQFCYLVTDADGGQWAFTRDQLKALQSKPENN